MRFVFEGTTYALVFHHANPDGPSGDRSTTCRILQVSPSGTTQEVACGESWCHWRDNYVKETGRKLALTRALKAFSGPEHYEFRKAVWGAYHNRAVVDQARRRASRVDWQAPLRQAVAA